MMLDAYFERTRRRLLEFLAAFLDRKRRDLSVFKPWGDDVLRRLAAFTFRGKSLRGGLVCLGNNMTGSSLSLNTLRAGAAMELVQSALLIHDDIMDRDLQRRGRPSLHYQYTLLAEKKRIEDPSHFGMSLGICIGEIALFLAYEALAEISGPRRRTAAAQSLFASELGLVGLGQMQDIYSSSISQPVTEGQVMNLYRFKTARYSFALPLRLGWLLGGGAPAVGDRLKRCGEALGLIFQLKDDELGLFGDPEVTGKAVGSDLRQGKKTPLILRLWKRATLEERTALRDIYGKLDIRTNDVAYVRSLVGRYGILDEISRVMGRYARQAKTIIGSLPVADRYKAVLTSLLDFSLRRQK
jgi:geranylgeranyl diphosphate synthase type I